MLTTSVKTEIGELAIFGGSTLFTKSLHVGAPSTVQKETLLNLIGSALDCNILTNDGPLVQKLEEELGQFLGVAHCILVSNATVGLQLVAKALEIRGEVLLPAFTFVGTASALSWIGLKPVFCDVDPDTHNIDPAEVRSRINARTGAILGVHLWGRAANTEKLETLGGEFGIPVFYDAAHAMGSSHLGVSLPSFGAASVVSLHATKCVTTLEGGLIATNSIALARKVKLLRNFGFQGEDDVKAIGINAKLNEFSAAMGLSSLKQYSALQNHNAHLHHLYQDCLRFNSSSIRIIDKLSNDNWNYHYAILEFPDNELRNMVHLVLKQENILARRYFFPGLNNIYPYKQKKVKTFPNSDDLGRRLLALPTGTQLQTQDACNIINLITFIEQNRINIGNRLMLASIAGNSGSDPFEDRRGRYTTGIGDSP